MKKLGILALVLCVAMTAMSAVSFAETEQLAYQGEITFYAQAYTPDPNGKTEEKPYALTAFQEVADAWEALHPGTTITFLDQVSGGQDYSTWLKTKIAGGQAPDIIWQHASNINTGVLPYGSTIELNEYLDRPNKYITGNEHWIDTFPASVIATNASATGVQPVINADYVATAVYYNTELFAQAGIETPASFVTWEEYNAICDKLKAAGVTPWAFSFGNNADDTAYITWFTRLFNTNAYYNDFANLAVVDANKSTLNPTEIYCAFQNGYFGVDNPKWIAWWELMKYQVDNYMPADAITSASTRDTVFAQFINGQIAMIWEGSWAPNNFRDANVGFEIGSFAFPYCSSQTNEYTTDFNSSACVGGPLAAFQYAISSEKADVTMTNDKIEACVDWLMFATTPENDALVCNDNGSFIPTVIGSVPSEANANLVALLNADATVIDDGIMSLGAEFNDVYYRTFQEYLRGNVTLDEAREALRGDLEEALESMGEALEDVDLTPYLNK